MVSDLRQVTRTIGPGPGFAYFARLIQELPDVFVSGNLVPVDDAMAGRTWTFNVNGTLVELDGRDFSGAREMYCRRVYWLVPASQFEQVIRYSTLGRTGAFQRVGGQIGARVIAVKLSPASPQ